MTWHADEVIAPVSAEVIRAVGSDSLLAEFAYHLTDPLEHDWHTPGAIHRLPAGGLLVVRPVCDESSADWYGEPVLDWRAFPARATPPPLVDRARVAESCGVEPDAVVAEPPLSYLKALAVKTGRPFVFYSCSMWGGDIDIEYAWVLGPSEVVFAIAEPDVPGRF